MQVLEAIRNDYPRYPTTPTRYGTNLTGVTHSYLWLDELENIVGIDQNGNSPIILLDSIVQNQRLVRSDTGTFALVFDPVTYRLMDFKADGTIRVMNPQTVLTTSTLTIPGFSLPAWNGGSGEYHAPTNRFYYADLGTNGPSFLKWVNITTGEAGATDVQIRGRVRVCAEDGLVYVTASFLNTGYTGANQTIRAVDPVTNTVVKTYTGYIGPHDVSVHPSLNTMFVVQRSNSPNDLVRKVRMSDGVIVASWRMGDLQGGTATIYNPVLVRYDPVSYTLFCTTELSGIHTIVNVTPV